MCPEHCKGLSEGAGKKSSDSQGCKRTLCVGTEVSNAHSLWAGEVAEVIEES